MGATCNVCGDDMLAVGTCIEFPVETVDGPLPPIPYGSEEEDWARKSVSDATTAPLSLEVFITPAATWSGARVAEVSCSRADA